MLKPYELGVTGVKRTIAQHRIIVANALLRLLNVRGPQAKVARACLEIMESPNGAIIDVSELTLSDLTEIKNYFAEVMGPIWCLDDGLVPGLKPHDFVVFDHFSTMYDFKIYRGDEPMLFSVKRKQGVTNTLKPGDVMRLIDTNQDLARKWKNSKQYRALRILDENSVVSGPIKVMARIYPGALPISNEDYQTVIRQLTRNDIILDEVPESFTSLIENEPKAAEMYEETEQVTGTMINFIFEKKLIEISKNDPDYNQFYIDATESNVQILKFDLDRQGNMYFRIEDPKNNDKMASFRSKQGIERRDMTGKIKLDKLGLTV